MAGKQPSKNQFLKSLQSQIHAAMGVSESGAVLPPSLIKAFNALPSTTKRVDYFQEWSDLAFDLQESDFPEGLDAAPYHAAPRITQVYATGEIHFEVYAGSEKYVTFVRLQPLKDQPQYGCSCEKSNGVVACIHVEYSLDCLLDQFQSS